MFMLAARRGNPNGIQENNNGRHADENMFRNLAMMNMAIENPLMRYQIRQHNNGVLPDEANESDIHASESMIDHFD